MALAQMQDLYGPPINPLYGTPSLPSEILNTIILLIFNPIFITLSFIIGIILYLKSHKKIFIIIPLIFAIIFLLDLILVVL